jgi:glutathione-regulated potassium-efflux system ancillary protein KefC/glutathione-regulated potassium-efflux system protein KefB
MPQLNEFAVILIAAVIALPLFKRLGFGTVLGYLIAGVAIGPSVLGLVQDVDRLRHLSELGVVLLLFIIGLELQPKRLWALRRPVFGLGGTQVLVTTVVAVALAQAAGLGIAAAVVAGFGLAMSSTALGLQTLAEKGQLTTQHGRTAFAILLFQDVAVIPMLAIVPVLAGDATTHPSPLLDIAKAMAVIVIVVTAGHFLLRPFFRLMAATDSNELFTAAALLVVVGTALLMDMADLSMALGSFMAGMLLADSEYRHQLEATIEPFKGLLLGLFFISVGMSVNLGLIADDPVGILGLAFALVAIKAAILFVLGRWHGLNLASSRNLAVALSQGGEFAFVLYEVAHQAGLIATETSQVLVAVVTVSMALTPLLFAANGWWDKRQRPQPEVEQAYDTIDEEDSQVIVAGFGRVGQVVTRILRIRRIPFTALEKSFSQVDFVRKFGGKVYFGDAARLELLHAAKADRAKVFVIAVDDVDASLRIAELVRRHFPRLKIFARARNRQHVYQLREIGAHVVVREVFHSSLELARHLLIEFGEQPEQARTILQHFGDHDNTLLLRQQAFHKDEAKLIASVKQYIQELEDLFEQDKRVPDNRGSAENDSASQNNKGA